MILRIELNHLSNVARFTFNEQNIGTADIREVQNVENNHLFGYIPQETIDNVVDWNGLCLTDIAYPLKKTRGFVLANILLHGLRLDYFNSINAVSNQVLIEIKRCFGSGSTKFFSDRTMSLEMFVPDVNIKDDESQYLIVNNLFGRDGYVCFDYTIKSGAYIRKIRAERNIKDSTNSINRIVGALDKATQYYNYLCLTYFMRQIIKLLGDLPGRDYFKLTMGYCDIVRTPEKDGVEKTITDTAFILPFGGELYNATIPLSSIHVLSDNQFTNISKNEITGAAEVDMSNYSVVYLSDLMPFLFEFVTLARSVASMDKKKILGVLNVNFSDKNTNDIESTRVLIAGVINEFNKFIKATFKEANILYIGQDKEFFESINQMVAEEKNQMDINERKIEKIDNKAVISNLSSEPLVEGKFSGLTYNGMV